MGRVTKIEDKENPYINKPGDGDGGELNAPDWVACAEFDKKLQEIKNSDLPFTEKLDLIVAVQTDILSLLFRESVRQIPNVDKSQVSARTAIVLKDMQASLVKKHDVSISEDIDLSSPKIQQTFMWFIDMFKGVLQGHMEKEDVDRVMIELSEELIGWEDKMQKRLKGLSAKALSNVENPLLNKESKDES